MSCRFPWCVSSHEPKGWGRTHHNEPAVIGDLTVLAVAFGDYPDVAGLVELRYSNPGLALDLTATHADSVAKVLDRIEGEHAAQVAAVVRAAADLIIAAEGDDI
ncbi:hypothetical protein ACGFI3_31680 [Nonomuraea wenchangensis]|uniref:hypothetical protein n=1 Tax=Nonomuraea wenchangensis TaxID=568860 RepID=UPI003718E203